jgi:MoaA/NifB/PqqE/SkfB family radical SAM enzyme
MTVADWRRVTDELSALGAGMVQFIGGEPTLHPALPALIDHALSTGLEVEVYSNLVHVTPALWATFERPGVRLATSYYADDPARHAKITGRPSHARTRANIARAVGRAIPIRVGVISVQDSPGSDRAVVDLQTLGVTDVGVDRARAIGRAGGARPADPSELCGKCGVGVVAVGPNGEVWPCVFSRWLTAGNVHGQSLAEILDSQAAQQARRELAAALGPDWPCVPRMCNPQCGPSCSPACRPARNCRPVGACVPSYG